MKRVTRQNMLRYIDMIKEYEKNEDEELRKKIVKFINKVINKDRHYYGKLHSYNFTKEQLKYCM